MIERQATGRVVRASYALRQQFRYEYPGPIRDLHHRLVIAPPQQYGDQCRLSQNLTLSPGLEVRWDDDTFGNAVATIEARYLESAMQVDYESVITREDSGEPLRLVLGSQGEFRYLGPSTLTVPSIALRAAAAEIGADASDPVALAERINLYVYEHMRYVHDSTTVATTASQAFAMGTGVCQDYAHVMVALCRICQLPARYVSGHLLGEGGTHAWVEVLVTASDGTIDVLSFDPTHKRRTTLDYVFIAAGRDYADVAPTSGRFVAPYAGRFFTNRSVGVIEAEYAA